MKIIKIYELEIRYVLRSYLNVPSYQHFFFMWLNHGAVEGHFVLRDRPSPPGYKLIHK